MTPNRKPDRRGAMPLKNVLLAGVVVWAAVVVCAAVALVPEFGDLLPRTREQDAVAAVVQRTIVTNQSVGIPEEREPNGRVSAETVEAMRAEIRNLAAELFTASYRPTWITRMDGVIDLVQSEFIVDGGADDFGGWQIAVTGDRAMVNVRCRIFLAMAQTFAGPRHRAENVVDYELTLERVGDVWLVSGESHRFAPGGGP